jgi:hypothetical protein
MIPGGTCGYSTQTNGTHGLEYIAFDDATTEPTDWERLLIPPGMATNFQLIIDGYGAVTGTVGFTFEYALGQVGSTILTSSAFHCEGNIGTNTIHEWAIDLPIVTNAWNILDIRPARIRTNDVGNITGDYYVGGFVLAGWKQ